MIVVATGEGEQVSDKLLKPGCLPWESNPVRAGEMARVGPAEVRDMAVAERLAERPVIPESG